MAIKNDVLSGKKWEDPRAVPDEYIAEMYAVDKKLPHHEINTSGDMVVSRSGLVLAVAGIANLADDEKEAAKKHIKKHYEDHELTIPGALLEGEMQEAGRLILDGEMLVGDEASAMKNRIPIRPGLETLKDGDEDPVDYVVRVKFRTNTKGWVYDDSAYDAIVSAIYNAKMPIPCFKGHQSQEASAWEFREHGGTVVGALKLGEYVYYRIVVDSDESKLKNLIRKGLLGEVSIWGQPTIVVRNGETHVIDYNLWSVDFTPPNRTGQENEIVSVGEIGDGSYEDLREAIQVAARAKYPEYTWVERTFDDKVVLNHEDKYYRVPYAENESGITLGDAEEVRRVVTYEPISKEEIMELDKVPTDELLAELKSRNTDGRLAQKAAGELGIALEDPKHKADSAKLQEIVAAAGEMDPIAAITYGKEAKAREEKAAGEKALGEMIATVKTEKGILDKDGRPAGEMASWVDKLGRFSLGMSREAIAGEIDRIMGDEMVKAAVEKKYVQQPKVPSGASAEEIPTVEV
jgi:hypothetical protein